MPADAAHMLRRDCRFYGYDFVVVFSQANDILKECVSPGSTDADRTTGILCKVHTPDRGDGILISRHRDNGKSSTQSGTGVPGNLDGFDRTEFGKRRLQIACQNRRRNIPNV
jgi:hypothetical protein